MTTSDGPSTSSSPTEREVAYARVGDLVRLRNELERDGAGIDRGYAELVESMAAVAEHLAEASRRAEWAIPPPAGGIERAVEIKLSETREVTVRIEPRAEHGEG